MNLVIKALCLRAVTPRTIIFAILMFLALGHADEPRENSLANKPSTQTKNPIKDFIRDFGTEDIALGQPFKGEKQLFQVEYDIDRDGEMDMLLSANFMLSGKAGTTWVVYLCKGKLYHRIDNSLTFRADYLYSALLKSKNTDVLLSYWPSSAETGTWHTVEYIDGQIIDAKLVVATSSLDGLKSYLEKIQPITVKKIYFRDLEISDTKNQRLGNGKDGTIPDNVGGK